MSRRHAEKDIQVEAYTCILKEHFPLSKRVEVRLVEKCKFGNFHGCAYETDSGKTYIIELWRGNSWQILIDPVLIHEWTHCRTFLHNISSDHPAEFWSHFGTIRNFLIDENGGALKHKHIERIKRKMAKRFNLEGSKE